MAIWTYVRNRDPTSKLTAISLEGGLVLRIGTYANLTSKQLEEIGSSGTNIVLEEGIIPPASPVGGSSNTSNASFIFLWETNTFYFANQLVAHEGESLRTIKNFTSGEKYEFGGNFESLGGSASGIPLAQKGAAEGVATLNSEIKIPTAQNSNSVVYGSAIKALGWVSPLTYGGEPAIVVTDATIALGSKSVESASGQFTSAMNGLYFYFRAAGTLLTSGTNAWEPSPLFGTFTYVSAKAGTLSVAAGSKVEVGRMAVGKDATEAINSALHTGECRLPSGTVWIVAGQIVYTANGQVIRGEGQHYESQLLSVTARGNGPIAAFWEDVVATNFQWWGNGAGSQPANKNIVYGEYEALVAQLAHSGCGVTFANVQKGLIDIHAYQCGGNGEASETNGIAGIYSTMGCHDSTFRGRVLYCRNGLNEDAFFGGGEPERFAPRNNTYELSLAAYNRFGQAWQGGGNSRGSRVLPTTSAYNMISGFDVNETEFLSFVGRSIALENGRGSIAAPGVDIYGGSLYVSFENLLTYGNGSHGFRIRGSSLHCTVNGVSSRNKELGGFINETSEYNVVNIISRKNNQSNETYDEFRITNSSHNSIYLKVDSVEEQEYSFREEGTTDYNILDDRSELQKGKSGSAALFIGAHSSPGSIARRKRALIEAQGMKGEAYERGGISGAVVATAGEQRAVLVELLAGDFITNLWMQIKTAGTSLTKAQLAVWSSTGTLLAVTADLHEKFNTSAATEPIKGGALGAVYHSPIEQSVYLGFLFVGGSPEPEYAHGPSGSGTLNGVGSGLPMGVGGTGNTGKTEAVALTITASSTAPWLGWS